MFVRGESPEYFPGPLGARARHCFARVIKSAGRDREFLDVPSSGLINYPYPFLASLAEKWMAARHDGARGVCFLLSLPHLFTEELRD